jgi:hypothetical protein
VKSRKTILLTLYPLSKQNKGKRLFFTIFPECPATDRVWNQKDRGIPLQKEKAASPDIVAGSQEEKCGLKYVIHSCPTKRQSHF